MSILVVTLLALVSSSWASHSIENSHGNGNTHDERVWRNSHESGQKHDDKVWLFAFSTEFPPLNALVEEAGESPRVDGLALDIIRAACQIAHKKCDYIFISTFVHCWDETEKVSPGLMNSWFDGCASTIRTIDSEFVHKFSLDYAEEFPTGLYVKSGDSLQLANLQQTANTIPIGFWTTFRLLDPECLQRHGLSVNENAMQGYDTLPELFDALNNGQVRAVLIFKKDVPVGNNFDELDIGQAIQCASGGTGVMVRKDSVGLLKWLNPALKQIIDSAWYAEKCSEWEQFFGVPAFCVGL